MGNLAGKQLVEEDEELSREKQQQMQRSSGMARGSGKVRTGEVCLAVPRGTEGRWREGEDLM